MNFDPYYIDPLFLQKENEKKLIRGAANRTAIAFLLMSAIMVLWSYPYFFVAKKFGIETLFYKWAVDDTLIHVFQILLSSIAFVVPYLILAKLFKLNLNDALQIKPVKEKGLFVPLMFLGLGVCGFVNVMSSIAAYILQNLGITYEANIHRDNPSGFIGVFLVILSTAITPAVVEEFAMRGVLLTQLKKFGEGFAVFVTAVVFGLMHGNFEQIPFAFLLGLYLGFITVKTESILPAVLLHFINNLFSVITGYLSDNLSTKAEQLMFPAYFLVLIAFGFIGILMLKEKNIFKFENTESVLSEKEKITAFIFAPSTIIVMAVVILEAFFIYA